MGGGVRSRWIVFLAAAGAALFLASLVMTNPYLGSRDRALTIVATEHDGQLDARVPSARDGAPDAAESEFRCRHRRLVASTAWGLVPRQTFVARITCTSRTAREWPREAWSDQLRTILGETFGYGEQAELTIGERDSTGATMIMFHRHPSDGIFWSATILRDLGLALLACATIVGAVRGRSPRRHEVDLESGSERRGPM